MMDSAAMTLVPVTAAMKEAFARSWADFESAVGMPLTSGWPQFPEAFAPGVADEPDYPWCGYLFVSGGRVVGNGGYAGPPDASHTVEIGYEIAPGEWNRGHATAAARRLLDFAFSNGADQIVAHSAPEWNASNRVMTKAGMHFVEAVPNTELGTAWRFAIGRDAYVER